MYKLEMEGTIMKIKLLAIAAVLFGILQTFSILHAQNEWASAEAPLENDQTYQIPRLYPVGPEYGYPTPPDEKGIPPYERGQDKKPKPKPTKPEYPYNPYPNDPYPYEPVVPEPPVYPNQPYYPYNPDQPYTPYYPYYPYTPVYPNNPYCPGYPCDPVSPTYPSYPNNPYNNVQVYKQWAANGSINLNWTIQNVTKENWGWKNVDIKCISGCHLLTNPRQTLWDIPYTVQRGGQLSFTVNIWQPMYGETMTFSIVAGSKTLYTFDVNPN